MTTGAAGGHSSSGIRHQQLSPWLWPPGPAASWPAPCRYSMLTLNGLLLGGAGGGDVARYSMAGDLLSLCWRRTGRSRSPSSWWPRRQGLSIGRALVTAGDRPRGEALRLAAADSLLVMGGCLPWFVVLAAVEGSGSLPNRWRCR